jgi:HK97 family phage major capsid protein
MSTEMRAPLKHIGGGRIGGYLIVWGAPDQRDLHGEYFTPDTELALDWYARRPVLYQHGMDDAVKLTVIGALDRLAPDETGVWAEAQLDLRHRYARAVLGLVDRGALGWSSGSLAHLVDVADDGHIRRWPVVEGSLTPTPAEPRRTDVHTVKMAYGALGLTTDALALPDDEGDDMHAMESQAVVAAGDLRKRLPAGKGAEAPRMPVEVGSAFDGLDAFDLLHGYMLMRHARDFRGVSERYANALSHKMRATGMGATKAEELSRSTLAGFGDEWVPDLWSAQLWQRARQDNAILGALAAVDMLSNPFELPTESVDPTVYFVPETADESQLTLGGLNPIPDSKIGSGRVTLNARKLALRAGFSAELAEDAIVPVLALYRAQAVRAIADAIDHVLLNGDTATTATGNINRDHAAPAATEKYLALDGLRKLPLVTNTAARVDAANAAPTLALLRQARFRLDARYAVRPADLIWIVDSGTYAKLLSLSEFLTLDKVGPQATVLTGQIGFVDGSPVICSAEMPLTEADGKVGAGPNDRGTALCVYRPGWVVGYRRRVAVNVDYIGYTDSYQLTATVRLALAGYDTKVAAALYNIAV